MSVTSVIKQGYECWSQGYETLLKANSKAPFFAFIPVLFLGIGIGFWHAEKVMQEFIDGMEADPSVNNRDIQLATRGPRVFLQGFKLLKTTMIKSACLMASFQGALCIVAGMLSGCLPTPPTAPSFNSNQQVLSSNASNRSTSLLL